ncbi:lactate racemase domain-containing protein [Microlunatus speluncae]|uniref:lactate racemase domain-containing protein n=1 Tax=Microlunatus speluncae TaxID=2594267 RepID=UPI00126646A1|nr:lactate racemase domain-containing protein [Microlunatus speluncae]
MARPGFVLEVDERTPPLVVHSGDAVVRQLFPLGAKVIYPPDPLPTLADVRGEIGRALDRPLGAEPLAARLRPDSMITILVEDLSVPVPSMPAPDVRGVIIEEVLSRAADAGVDDVQVIAATGLRRRLTGAELRRLVGERVYRSFSADGLLRNHDAEDDDRLTGIGAVSDSTVRVDRRVIDSDVVVVVRIAGQPAPAFDVPEGSLGHWLAAGVGSTATITGLTGPDGEAIARLVGGAVDAFAIDAVLDNRTFGAPVEFLGRREWEWGLRDQARATVLRQGLALTPSKLRRSLVNNLPGSYGVVSVVAGDPAQVADAAAETVRKQQLVEVEGQADVAVVGVPQAGPCSVGSVTNPLLAAWSGLVGTLGAATGKPVVRDRGAVIVYHPARSEFSPLHHPSYVDFFDEVLPSPSTGSGQAAATAEAFAKFADDEWYRHLYRTGHAFHGVHPFLVWAEVTAATARLSDVVWVGGDRATVARMGFRAASSLADALEMTAASVGSDPKISYLHSPPRVLAEVT